MENLTALFTAICDRFTGAAWFQYVQWPFWTFLFLIALGGVYNARFQKNTLFCRSLVGALKLTMIYLVAVGLHVAFPKYMATVSQLPFLSISEETITLVNPLGLLDRIFTALPQVFVRLYFLLFLVNATGSFDYSGRNLIPWLFSQFASCAAAILIYEAISLLTIRLWRLPPSWFYNIIAILLLLVATVMITCKLFFIVTKKSGNHAYSVTLQFLTGRFGSLFTISFFSLLMVTLFLILVNSFGNGRMLLANFNRMAYFLICAMCTLTLCVFSLFYTERQPG